MGFFLFYWTNHWTNPPEKPANAINSHIWQLFALFSTGLAITKSVNITGYVCKCAIMSPNLPSWCLVVHYWYNFGTEPHLITRNVRKREGITRMYFIYLQRSTSRFNPDVFPGSNGVSIWYTLRCPRKKHFWGCTAGSHSKEYVSFRPDLVFLPS